MSEETRPEERRTPQPDEFLNPEELFRTIDKIRRSAKPLEPLWGYFLFKKAITSIVGDPGVCKTSLGYGLAKELCKGRSFLDIAAEEVVNVLYMDFESADSLVSSRANLIIGDEEIPNLYIYNIADYYLPQIAKVTIDFCKAKNVNLIFVDNQSMAFNTRDENDNAEAIKQMRFLRSFVIASDVSCVSFHHTSKANSPGTRSGSGAYARARLADICINIDIPSPDDPDIVRLQIAKNRMIDEKVLWYIKKEEGKFHFTDPPLGAIGQPTNTLMYKAQRALLVFMEPWQEYSFGALSTQIGTNGLTMDIVDKALRRLVQQGRIQKPRHGIYVKPSVESRNPNSDEKSS